MKYSAIILAAGSGVRTGLSINKVLIEINGKRVLDYSVDFFNKSKDCTDIVLVCSERDFNFVFANYNDKVNSIIIGGSTRQESVDKGLNKAVSDYVLVHDSARPFINSTVIKELLVNLQATKANTTAVLVKDTIIKSSGNRLGKSLDRKELLAIQTPQGFERDLLLKAHKKALEVGYLATDDTDLISKFTNITPSYVLGDYRSIKLTTRDDIKFLEVIL
jgi:2-C-methyl-D-erythritol 4-phosphate cytidylyltransferase